MSKRKPSPTVATTLSPRFFKALADPNRIAIVQKFIECGCSCTVSQTAGCCAVDLSVVSRHLAILREAGILEAERRGKEVYYSLRNGSVVETLRAVADLFEARAGRCARNPSRTRYGHGSAKTKRRARILRVAGRRSHHDR